MVSVQQILHDKLKAAFDPEDLTIVDESHLHEGHAGARPGGESHFRVKIVSVRFSGTSRIQRHRMINEVLAEELAGPVHALAIKAEAPV